MLTERVHGECSNYYLRGMAIQRLGLFVGPSHQTCIIYDDSPSWFQVQLARVKRRLNNIYRRLFIYPSLRYQEIHVSAFWLLRELSEWLYRSLTSLTFTCPKQFVIKFPDRFAPYVTVAPRPRGNLHVYGSISQAARLNMAATTISPLVCQLLSERVAVGAIKSIIYSLTDNIYYKDTTWAFAPRFLLDEHVGNKKKLSDTTASFRT
ncbi:hypothetical protein V1527DRAFT_466543 [Lipomyces starkeyi]